MHVHNTHKKKPILGKAIDTISFFLTYPCFPTTHSSSAWKRTPVTMWLNQVSGAEMDYGGHTTLINAVFSK